MKRTKKPCDLCGGICTNGAQCGVAQLVGKAIDWTSEGYPYVTRGGGRSFDPKFAAPPPASDRRRR